MKFNVKIKYIGRLKIFIFFLLLGLSFRAFPQSLIKKAFAPRTSQQSPGSFQGKAIYNLQGDFNMIGNANARSLTGPDNGYNMSFNKLLGDATNTSIKNSSSADFVLPANTDLACTKIVFAGLYWTGRGDDNSTDVLSKTGNAGNGMNKKTVKFKVPGATDYIDLTATDIFYGGSDVSGMYTGFYDVTNLVSAAKTGTYAVANIATFEGSDDLTNPRIGYYAGWGLVIVYENATMPWRNITVFDGFGYVKGSANASNYGTLDVSGFQAVQNGNVNIKMGFMAGEGDRSVTGDYFRIQNRLSNTYTSLYHGANTSNNFFNSSIFTGGNPRVPNNLDNDGIDIAMFNLDNSGNALIDNNQSTTTFRYGSSGDYYNIFNITFAVDAYIPDVQVFNANISSIPNGSSLNQNQEVEFISTIYNKGTEGISNGIVEIPIPFNMHYVSALVDVGPGTVTWTHPSGATDPAITPGGTLRWNVGDLVKPTDPNTVLARLKYRLRVTNDCTLLKTGGACSLIINVDGTFSGSGTTSGIPISNGFVIGYNSDCGNTPIRDPFNARIVPSQAFLDNCPNDIVSGSKQFSAFCSISGNVFPRASITANYPAGTKFYTQIPGTPGFTATEVLGNFAVNQDGTARKYYAVVVGMVTGCYLNLETILKLVVTQPTVSNIQYCIGSPSSLAIQLSPTGVANGYQLFYFDNGATSPRNTPPSPTAAGSYTYQVAEGATVNGITCMGPKVSFNIQINALPAITKNLSNISVCADAISTIAIESDATQYSWEYATTANTTWQPLVASAFQNQLLPNGKSLTIDNPSIDLDQMKLRVKLTTASGCITYTNEAVLEVKLCNIITNPMLPGKIIKN
ncbi:hypothetical protein [Pedobacter sandarakinus]|uniref:hypothetical protein n=1 Tax=Pedobacter sandarakinus TaxID=353156 RepID=UPI002247E113|nr:hypothetical protein [Pedobacter sandarakinus]MCX2576364.1 hypothetical protein [Pedobacter sandarakinus]